MRVSLRRDVHDLFVESTFAGCCDVPILRDIDWAGTQPMPCADLQAMVDLLARRRTRFAVFDDFTLLYAMLDQPAPQPLLWNHAGLTFSERDNAQLDTWILDSLIENEVELVIGASDVDSFRHHFPRVSAHLGDRFALGPPIGPFTVYERRSQQP
jgi:hypothetical protein